MMRKQVRSGMQATDEKLESAHCRLATTEQKPNRRSARPKRRVDTPDRARETPDLADRRLRNIIDFLPDALVEFDREGRVVAWNKAMEAMTGTKRGEIIGRDTGAYAVAVWGDYRPMLADAILFGQPDIAGFYDNVQREGDALHTEVFVPGRNEGRARFVVVKAAPLYDRQGNVAGAVESVRDISERKRFEYRLKYLGTHDRLTGLYNRRYFEREMQYLQQQGVSSLGIILCDVDGLKLVNDSLGHDEGDKLLIAAADLVGHAFQKTDIVARVDGDEFGVLLAGGTKKDVESGAERVRRAVCRYNAGRRGAMPLSMSVGGAYSAASPPDVLALYKDANNNMHRAKLHQVRSARSATVQTLMRALRARDYITEGHADRLQDLMVRVGKELGLARRTVGDLRLLAQFHDIGKVGIPDRILFKPGPLDHAETKEMQRHSAIGYRIALSAPDLLPIAEWILHHHEWWDGRGYPMGLKGEEIPLACRILALADAYDAMTSDRPYREAMSHAAAVVELERCAGTQFAPGLTFRFIRILETMPGS